MTTYYKKLSLIFLGLLISGQGIGQNFNETPEFLKANSRWIFGVNAGLDFSTGTAVPVLTEMDANEGPATVSDPLTGNLLFYSNGQECRNASGLIMPNGDSLLGNSGFSARSGRSTAQGTCIVPVIGETDQYYLFSLNGMTNSQPNYALGSLFYSVVDMSLEGGQGNIVASSKNTVLNQDVLSESMIAVPGNNCDVWLIVHAFEDDKFLAYHITHEGIDTTPVVSSTGGGPQLYAYVVSWMAVSPNREKIAISGGTTPPLVAQFDPENGQVSNAITLAGNRDLAFSPDNSKLYIFNGNSEINQYDLSVHDSAAINSSRASIPISQSGDFRLYNDTIYYKPNGTNTVIHRINQPNLSGLACDLELDAITQLTGTRAGGGGMGSDVVFPMPPDTLSMLAVDTVICPGSGLTLSPTGGMEVIAWSDGSTGTTLEISQTGTYWAMQSDGCHYHIDTFVVEVFDFPEPVITIDVLELGTVATYDSYQWLLNGNVIPNAVQSTYEVLENGDYQVVVTNGEGCIDTSEVYVVTNADETAIDEIQRVAAEISLYPNPVKNVVHINTPVLLDIQLVNLQGKTISTVHGRTTLSLEGIAEGVYFLKLYDQQNRLIKTEKIIKIR